MVNINNLQLLRKTDLNSIIFFLVVMQHKTIFNASIALNCSAPTVSLMLKRFCSYFPVPLFEREGRCLLPTRHAIELNKKLTEIFKELESILYPE